MPLPLGHAAIGLTSQDMCSRNNLPLSRWRVPVFVIVLANLPDIDVVIGLLFEGNGCAYHRGPTHGLLFAVLVGFLASAAWKLWSRVPKMSFGNCFLLILSHVLADAFFTSSPVSFFWPLEVNWAIGFSGWTDQDTGIIIGCGLIIVLTRLVSAHPDKVRSVSKEARILDGLLPK